MNFSVTIYQRKSGGQVTLTTIGFGPHAVSENGPNPSKVERRLAERLRKLASELEPNELARLELVRGTELRRIHLELTLRGRTGKYKASGRFPLIVEPHYPTRDRVVSIAYHPMRQREWFPLDEEEAI